MRRLAHDKNRALVIRRPGFFNLQYIFVDERMRVMDRILLLEDDLSLTDGLCYFLKKSNYEVEAAQSLKEARALLERRRYDLLLLDVTLPDGSGFEICESIRGRQDRVPVIFLTASDEEMNVIRGLDSGGDDYITKPFRPGELLARIRALLRRAESFPQGAERDTLICGQITVDFAGSRVYLGGKRLELTQVEYRLLCLLVRSCGRVVTREMILEELWDGAGSFVDDNTLSVYIRRLREKVEEDPSRPQRLITARGFGYCWREE